MEMTNFLIKILILCLPGIIVLFVEDIGSYTTEKSKITIIIRGLIYSLIAYFILKCIYSICNIFVHLHNDISVIYWEDLKVHFFDFLNEDEQRIHADEIFFACIIAAIMSIIKTICGNIIYEYNHIAHISGNSNPILHNPNAKTGFGKFVIDVYDRIKSIKFLNNNFISNNDIWNYVFTELNAYVLIMDWQNKLCYYGLLVLCSSNHKDGEMYIEKGFVINLNTLKYRQVDSMYLSKDSSSFWDIQIVPLGDNPLETSKKILGEIIDEFT